MNDPTVLIAGVPFGCDNVGDEAILECTVRIVREVCPFARVTVSTADGVDTAEKLGVDTVGLFGFGTPYRRRHMVETIEAHDVFLWGGATGLSDYPEIPVEMLEIAQRAGCRTVLWGVGMNRQLNPIKYKVLPGKRKRLLTMITRLSGGRIDGVARTERRWETRARERIAAAVDAADLAVVRDPQSRAELARCGTKGDVVVGADSALILEPAAPDSFELPGQVREILDAAQPVVGLCISAQRAVRDLGTLTSWLNRFLEDAGARLLFVPMNPVTDAQLMEALRSELNAPGKTAVLAGRYEPGEVLAVLSRLDAAVSSRLHMLILASIGHVPLVGISRGSKIDNFLEPFGLSAAGSVDSPDVDILQAQLSAHLEDAAAFRARSRSVRAALLKRLEHAKDRLRNVLSHK